MSNKFQVIFRGVRGSRPVPGPETIQYGGNTSCIQLVVGDRNLIFDAGTGICQTDNFIKTEGDIISIDLFLSHLHWDHIQGFPFFTPAYKQGNVINIYGLNDTQQALYEQQSKIFFPVLLQEMKGQINFIKLEGNDSRELKADINVKTYPGNHQQGCLLYRVEYKGYSCCYVTDYEHSDRIDPGIINFVEKTDLLIYDAQFTDQEYYGLEGKPSRRGWGHSTWQEGIKLATESKAKKIILFHHSPFRSDEELQEIEAKAKKKFPSCQVAREGLLINLC